jgi:sodium/proline symporter
MAIKDDRELKKSTHIAMSWVIISLFCAVAIGIVGRAYLSVPLENAEAEKVFVIMSEQMFPSFITGLIWSAILAAIMSTASSQLLVTASAVSRDIYQSFIHQNAPEKRLILVSRLTVLAVAACAVFLASDPDSYIFQMVSYAWAGFGACFGPAVLMSLYWKRMTLRGAYAGIIIGGLTVIVWKYFSWFGLYELIPGFFLSAAAIWLVSLYDHAPSAAIEKEFDETVRRSSSR